MYDLDRSFVRRACAHVFVCSLFRSFVRSFVHQSFAHSFVCSFVRSFTRSIIRSLVRLFVRLSFVRSLTRSSACKFLGSVARSLVRSFVRSFKFVHSLHSSQTITNLAQDSLRVRLHLGRQLHPGHVSLDEQVGLHMWIVIFGIRHFMWHTVHELK